MLDNIEKDLYKELSENVRKQIEITKALEILKVTLIDKNLANKDVFRALLEVILDNNLASEARSFIEKMKAEIN